MLGEHGIQLLDHRLLAWHDATVLDKVPVQRGVVLPRRQATVAATGFMGQMRVDPVQIRQDFMDGIAQAVHIQAAEFHAVVGGQQAVVPVQPLGEGFDFAIAPHPGWKTAENMAFPRRVRQASDVLIDMPGIRPVGLDGDDVEAMLFDQAPGDRHSGAIELAAAVACLAQQDDARVSVAVEQRCECRRIQVRQRFGVLVKHRGYISSVDLILLAVEFFHQFLRRAVHGEPPVIGPPRIDPSVRRPRVQIRESRWMTWLGSSGSAAVVNPAALASSRIAWLAAASTEYICRKPLARAWSIRCLSSRRPKP